MKIVVKTQEDKTTNVKKIFMCAKKFGENIGELVAYDYGRHLTVPLLSVEPKYFGKGVGKQLLKELSERFEKPIVVLFPLKSATGFYKKAGFKRIPFSLQRFKRFPKNERRLVNYLRKEYYNILKMSKDDVLFASHWKIHRKTRR